MLNKGTDVIKFKPFTLLEGPMHIVSRFQKVHVVNAQDDTFHSDLFFEPRPRSIISNQ